MFDDAELKTILPEANLIRFSKKEYGSMLEIWMTYPITRFEEIRKFRPRSEMDRFDFLTKELGKMKQLEGVNFHPMVYDDLTHATRHMAYEVARSIVSKERFYTHTAVQVQSTDDSRVLTVTVHNDDIKNAYELSQSISKAIWSEFEKSDLLSRTVKLINMNVGKYPMTYDYPHNFNNYDDDEYDERSPNWPSKTGNPSGGGRDNNPPK